MEVPKEEDLSSTSFPIIKAKLGQAVKRFSDTASFDELKQKLRSSFGFSEEDDVAVVDVSRPNELIETEEQFSRLLSKRTKAQRQGVIRLEVRPRLNANSRRNTSRTKPPSSCNAGDGPPTMLVDPELVTTLMEDPFIQASVQKSVMEMTKKPEFEKIVDMVTPHVIKALAERGENRIAMTKEEMQAAPFNHESFPAMNLWSSMILSSSLCDPIEGETADSAERRPLSGSVFASPPGGPPSSPSTDREGKAGDDSEQRHHCEKKETSRRLSEASRAKAAAMLQDEQWCADQLVNVASGEHLGAVFSLRPGDERKPLPNRPLAHKSEKNMEQRDRQRTEDESDTQGESDFVMMNVPKRRQGAPLQ